MDVLPIPTLADLNIIIPGALRQPHVSLTFSMTPDEFAIVQVSAAAPHIAERDAANLIRDRAVMERTEALEQLAATMAQIQKLHATNIDNATLITTLQQQLADGTSDRLRIVLTENDTLSKQLTSKQELLDSANRTIAGQLRTNQAQSDMLKEALAKLAKYEPGTPLLPTVIPGDVVPGEVKPVITRNELRNVAMVTITKDDTPSPAQDEMTKQIITLSGTMGFNAWRGLLNAEEVRVQSGYAEDDPRSLPAFGRKHGLLFIADTVDSQAKRVTDGTLNMAQYVDYFVGLKKLGARAVYFDDVDAERKAADIHEWIALTLEAMKDADFDVPLMGSFMATFDESKYPGLHHYEIQCFGSPDELRKYVARKDIRIFCLDGQRSASVKELKANAAIILAANIPNVAMYTGFDGNKAGETDWRTMTAQVAEHKDFLTKWKAQRLAIVAQPA